MNSLEFESTSGAQGEERGERTAPSASGEQTGQVGEGGTSRPGSADDGSGEDTLPSKDVIFDILKNQRRRRVIDFLREHGSSTLSDLAEHVSAIENDKDVMQLTSTERKRVYVGLYQCHLPRMDDADVIDFDRDRGDVELRRPAEGMFPYLDLDPRDRAEGNGWGLGSLRHRLASLVDR